MANKAIKYRLYPTTEQSVMFAKTFGCCRKVYNLMLADKIAYYQEHGEMLSTTPAQYKVKYSFLKEVDSLALANEQLHLQTAYKNFFRDKRIGFPKYKSAKHSRKSYTTNNQKGTIAICDDAIKLPKIGKVKAVIHRQPDSNWVIKSATISQDSDGKFYVAVIFEYDADIIVVSKKSTNAVGLDYKSDGLYMDSSGNIGSNHKYYRESHKKLIKAQRRLSRMVGSGKNEPKSNNYLKQLEKLNKIHRHIANQRLDNLHKKSTEIANRYDIVCVESLNMRAMSNKGFGNGKATMDNGYGMFLNMLSYKLADRGKHFVKVDKWYPSSQILHCHPYFQIKLDLSERVIKCPECGCTYDRDHNAAINILHEGLRLLREEAA